MPYLSQCYLAQMRKVSLFLVKIQTSVEDLKKKSSKPIKSPKLNSHTLKHTSPVSASLLLSKGFTTLTNSVNVSTRCFGHHGELHHSKRACHHIEQIKKTQVCSHRKMDTAFLRMKLWFFHPVWLSMSPSLFSSLLSP